MGRRLPRGRGAAAQADEGRWRTAMAGRKQVRAVSTRGWCGWSSGAGVGGCAGRKKGDSHGWRGKEKEKKKEKKKKKERRKRKGREKKRGGKEKEGGWKGNFAKHRNRGGWLRKARG